MEEHDLIAWNTMLAAYTHSDNMDELTAIPQQMPELDIVSWNTILSAYARSGDSHTTEQIFHRMTEADLVSSTTMLKFYAESRETDQAQQVSYGLPHCNDISWTVMIKAYRAAKTLTYALISLTKPAVVMWEAMLCVARVMLGAYASNGVLDEAKGFFDSEHGDGGRVISHLLKIQGHCENRARDLSHPKRESNPLRTNALQIFQSSLQARPRTKSID
ncbi:pentatricopeptide repeat-containing protein At4g02750-like [Selaginella moellendorffii]|uniref:pentatricopeptide repeat-containing protein At4g02750-like n=1 Tax=Selaginella moellendorffii TaxID=88036 RepID=UPI000D1C3C70|nr:pentatricopeptide repeat-containing protein At4g02750-like [Selaginella moellendorffii]|eukprot:XP_024542642.1 pentatricopeptide repeat-containing protein At4g02750-like [Selaginella moellendorffii]